MTSSILPPPPLAIFLEDLRTELNLSREDFAEGIDCDPKTIKNIRKGDTQKVNPKTLNKFIEFIERQCENHQKADTFKKQLIETNELARQTMGGRFPYHLEAVRKLLNNKTGVRNGVDILVDCADYGSFFHPLLHGMISKRLITLSGRIAVRVLAVGPIQPITSAAEFMNVEHKKRMGDENFKKYLDYYLAHLRNKKRAEHSSFREWLNTHIADDCREMLSWVRRYALHREALGADHLSHWMNRAQSIVYDSDATFTADPDDEGPLLALLWSRERYFEEILLGSGVNFKRLGTQAPAVTIWLTGRSAIYAFNQTDLKARGWAFSTMLIKGKMRNDCLFVLSSIFDKHWAEDPAAYSFSKCSAATMLAGEA